MRSNLITSQGYQQLNDELNYLWKTHRPEITQKVAWAASLGDRSENADYHNNKRLLREIDRRIRYLQKRLPELRVIEYSPEQEGKAYFGAYVEIDNDDGEIRQFRIVGYDEIFKRSDCISVDTPMAKALLGKEVDDEIIVNTPSGQQVWYVLSIRYPQD